MGAFPDSPQTPVRELSGFIYTYYASHVVTIYQQYQYLSICDKLLKLLHTLAVPVLSGLLEKAIGGNDKN
jgi:hypothetical protein